MASKFLSRTNGQTLKSHLEGVAALCENFAPDGWGRLLYYAGLYHDLGKFLEDWQAYLRRGKRTGKPHAIHGALYARACGLHPIISMIIKSHHGRLQSLDDFRESMQSCSVRFGPAMQLAVKNACSEIKDFAPPKGLNPPKEQIRDLDIRLLFSILVDADMLDAAQSQGTGMYEGSQTKQKKKVSIPASIAYEDNPINRIRALFLEDIIQRAGLARGLFNLTGGCGIGKTNAMFRFAAKHSEINGMDGIIYVGPFMSIIQQNTKVARELFGDDAVLEHHSNYNPPETEDPGDYKLHCDRWDLPVVCTTGVMFWESIFSSAKHDCRRLHNIRNRVILIDEAQSIPTEFAYEMMDVCRELVNRWGCSVVLSSATNPDFSRDGFTATPLVSTQIWKASHKALRRHQFEYLQTPMDWESVKAMVTVGKTMIVVNTTGDARDGFAIFKDMGWLHLSGRMCVAHRDEVIAEIAKNETSLIATPIIEAGVDLSFKYVWRQMAGLDSILQAAGRCNRNGEMPWQDAIVRAFWLADARKFPDIDALVPMTKRILEYCKDLFGDDYELAVREYFKWYYGEIVKRNPELRSARERLDFPKIEAATKMIRGFTVSVAVPWKEGSDLIAKYQKPAIISKAGWKELQPFTAAVPRQLNKYIRVFPNGLAVWCGEYDPFCGCFTDETPAWIV